jgi:thiamine-phosphate pyrophosphorylase
VIPNPPVLLITDRSQATAPLETVVAGALAAGCRWVLLREKDLERRARLALLRRLVDLGRPWNARVLVSADPAAAKDAGAAGVHLPAGTDPTPARKVLGSGHLIGVSAHNLTEAQAAADAGADYVTLSPIFESASKPGYGPALGLEALGAAAARLALPVLALGGIGPGNAARCLAGGATGVAVMGEIMRAPDSGAAMSDLIAALGRGGS